MNSRPIFQAITVALSLMLFTAAAHAQTGASLRLLPWQPDATAELEHDTTFFENGRVEITPGPGTQAIQLTRHDTQGRFRLDSANPMSLSFGFESHVIDIHGPMGNDFGQLVDQSIAMGFEVGQWQDIHIQAYAGLGYAGNEPYTDEDNLYGLAGVILNKPLSEHWSGVLTVGYDGNRSIFPDIPLPAVGAIYTGREDLRLLVGFPVSNVVWTPDDRWTLELHYALLYSGRARVGYKLFDSFELFAAAKTSMEAFDDEDDFGTGADNRRLFFEQKTIEAGFDWALCPMSTVTLAAGYAFDQEFSTGWDVRDLDNEAELSDEPFIRVGAEVKF